MNIAPCPICGREPKIIECIPYNGIKEEFDMTEWKGSRNPDNPQEGYYVGLMNACGYRTEDLKKPVIGIAEGSGDTYSVSSSIRRKEAQFLHFLRLGPGRLWIWQ